MNGVNRRHDYGAIITLNVVSGKLRCFVQVLENNNDPALIVRGNYFDGLFCQKQDRTICFYDFWPKKGNLGGKIARSVFYFPLMRIYVTHQLEQGTWEQWE